MAANFDFDRLKAIGYKIRCCELCLHSRFYEKKSPWGLCAKYGTDEEPVRIHNSGRCSRGFKPDPNETTRRGLNVLVEFS